MISKIIKQRRSISKFLEKEVDIKIINEIIDISAYAPSSCNTQPWYFLVFNSQDSKDKLNSYIEKGYEFTKKDISEKHKLLGNIYVKLLNFFEKYGKFDKAPIYVLLFARPYDTPLFSQAIKLTKNKQIEKIASDSVKTSSAMAMQNFLLLACEKGLGTRVKDGIKFLQNFEELKKDFYKEFDVPLDYELISGIQVGYPEENIILKEKTKLPLDKIRRVI